MIVYTAGRGQEVNILPPEEEELYAPCRSAGSLLSSTMVALSVRSTLAKDVLVSCCSLQMLAPLMSVLPDLYKVV